MQDIATTENQDNKTSPQYLEAQQEYSYTEGSWQ